MKKFVALSMLFALLAGSLSGCNETTGTTGTSGGSTTQGTQAEEKLKFTFMGTIWDPHPETSIIFEELMKRTNTEITFQWHPAANYADKIGVVLASKDIPEVISGGTVGSLRTQGAIVALDDYLEKYGKDMLAALKPQDMPFIRNAADGKIYTFPMILDFPPAYAMQIREDWLANVGISKVPETWNEWKAAWKAFKDQDANKDGKVDNEVPLVGDVYSLLPAFGINASSRLGFVIDKNDNYTMIYEMPEFRDFLTEMQVLYKDGILDKEFSSRGTFINAADLEKVFHANLGGSAMTWAANTKTSTDVLRETVPEAKVISTKPLVGPKGDSGIPARGRLSGSTALTITGEKKAEGIVSFFNKLYTPEFETLMSYGVEGTTYEMVDGKPKYIEPYGNTFTELRKVGLNFTPFPHVFPEEAYLQVTLGGKDVKDLPESTKLMYDALYSPGDKFFPSVPTMGTPAYAEKQAQVMPELQKLVAECITGTITVDKFYEEYEKLKPVGLKEILDEGAEAYKMTKKK